MRDDARDVGEPTASGWRYRCDPCVPALAEDHALLIEALLICRDGGRRVQDWLTADTMRNALRAVGVCRLCDRELEWTMRWQPSAARDNSHYDAEWRARASQLQLISLESLVAESDAWSLVPRLQTYRGLSKEARREAGAHIGTTLYGIASRVHDRVALLSVEKPYLDGFVDGFLQAAAAAANGHSPEFVLLALNGGDEPLTRDLQARIAMLRAVGLRVCWANNLHACDALHTLGAPLFRPLPIGAVATHGGACIDEPALLRIAAAAPPWAERDRRLLVAPMKLTSRSRAAYLDVLSSDSFCEVVRVVSGRIPFEDFLVLLASHRCALSPPGRGHDCFRTWQALSVGTVPLVVEDPNFESGLLGLGPVALPPPHELTPAAVRELLERLDPPDTRVVGMGYWRDAFCASGRASYGMNGDHECTLRT